MKNKLKLILFAIILFECASITLSSIHAMASPATSKVGMHKFYHDLDDRNRSAKSVLNDFTDDFVMFSNGKLLDREKFCEHLKFIRNQTRHTNVRIISVIAGDNYTLDMHEVSGYKNKKPFKLKFITKIQYNKQGKIRRIDEMSFPIGDNQDNNIGTGAGSD